MTELTVAFIAKDAAKTIGQAISSVMGVADQVVVVVDDRTTDDTEHVANEAIRAHFAQCPGPERWPGVIVRRPWNHHFADARNASLDLATGAYVMVMDADEYIAPGDAEKVKAALQSGADLYTCPVFLDATYGDPNYEEAGFGRCGIEWRNRIFRRAAGARYIRRVHEQLFFPGDDFVEEILPVRFYHAGSMTSKKSEYYSALLYLDHVDDPLAPVPACMLADRALIRHDAATAHSFIRRIDPDQIMAPGTKARYFVIKGKIAQCVYVRTIQEGKRRDAIAEEAIGYYLKAHEICPVQADGATHAAILMFAAFHHRCGEAAGLLERLLQDDPGNIAAAEMLEIWRRFGHDYDDFRERLGFYINHMGQSEREAALQADGYSPDAHIARLEQLDEMLSGGPQAPAAAADFAMGDR